MANLLIALAGATGLELNLPELHSGRSNQLVNITPTPLLLDLTLTPHRLGLGIKCFLIDKLPGTFTPGISASALVVTKKSFF